VDGAMRRQRGGGGGFDDRHATIVGVVHSQGGELLISGPEHHSPGRQGSI
jgi:hypothetical protein